MEVVGAVASLTGILCFVGQALEGLVALKTLMETIKRAPKNTAEVLEELERLKVVLDECPRLLETLKRTTSGGVEYLKSNLEHLNTDVLKCVQDVEKWNKELSGSTVTPSKKGLRWLKNATHLAFNKEKANDLRTKLAARRQELQLRVSIIGRILDHINEEKLATVNRKLDGISETGTRISDKVDDLRSSIQTHISSLENVVLERLSSTQSEVVSAMAKLAATTPVSSCSYDGALLQKRQHKRSRSLAEPSLEPIHTPSGILKSPPGILRGLPRTAKSSAEAIDTERNAVDQSFDKSFTCGALTGIDDAIQDDGNGGRICVFCGQIWTYDEDSSQMLGRHLVQKHAFSQCNFDYGYATWKELHKHLLRFHGWKSNADRRTGMLFFRGSHKARREESPYFSHKQTHKPRREPDQGANPLLHLNILNGILNQAGLGVRLDPSITLKDMAHQMCIALAGLDRLAATSFSQGHEFTNADISDLLYHAARVQEAIIQAGFEDLFDKERFYVHDYFEIEQITELFGAGPWAETSPYQWEVNENALFGKLPPTSSLFKASERDGRRSYKTYQSAIRHLWAEYLDSSNYFDSIPGLLIVGSNIVLRQRKHHSNTKSPGKTTIDAQQRSSNSKGTDSTSRHYDDLNGWFWGIFRDSPSFRRLLRSGKAVPGISGTKAKFPRYWTTTLLWNWSVDAALPTIVSEVLSAESEAMACMGSDSSFV